MKTIDSNDTFKLIENLFSALGQEVNIERKPIKVVHKGLRTVDMSKFKNLIITGLVSIIEQICKINGKIKSTNDSKNIIDLLKSQIGEIDEVFYKAKKYYGFKRNIIKIKFYITRDNIPEFCLMGTYKLHENKIEVVINCIGNMEECHKKR